MINHTSFVNLYNKDQKIFDNLFSVTNLKSLTSKIIQISKNFKDLSYPDSDKVKGDLFEIFAEGFFKILASDNRVGVYNYQPASPIDDYGVDGFGIGMDDKPCTIQIKFRSNKKDILIQNDIKQFALQSIVNYGVDKDTKTNMIVFTNSNGLHWVTEEKVFSGRVKDINHNQIAKLIDDNSIFWKMMNDLVKETIISKYNIK